MSRQICVDLSVKDLKRSVEFFTALGFSFQPRFPDENATCMIAADDIFAMLLVEPFLQTVTDKPVADAHAGTEALVCLGAYRAPGPRTDSGRVLGVSNGRCRSPRRRQTRRRRGHAFGRAGRAYPPLPLHENATRKFAAQCSHRARAKPCARIPHSR